MSHLQLDHAAMKALLSLLFSFCFWTVIIAIFLVLLHLFRIYLPKGHELVFPFAHWYKRRGTRNYYIGILVTLPTCHAVILINSRPYFRSNSFFFW